jgi:hypothetical protein
VYNVLLGVATCRGPRINDRSYLNSQLDSAVKSSLFDKLSLNGGGYPSSVSSPVRPYPIAEETSYHPISAAPPAHNYRLPLSIADPSAYSPFNTGPISSVYGLGISIPLGVSEESLKTSDSNLFADTPSGYLSRDTALRLLESPASSSAQEQSIQFPSHSGLLSNGADPWN